MALRLIVENRRYVSISSIRSTPGYSQFIHRLKAIGKPPNIQFLNKNIIEEVLNHICNLRVMNGAVERLAFVIMDKEAVKEINQRYPFIPVLIYDNHLLQGGVINEASNGTAASRQFASYQLMFIFRINLARAILNENISFWSTQPDSIWRGNLYNLGYDSKDGEFDLYFDETGNDELFYFRKVKGWICGSMFFARANDRTRKFFDRAYELMLRLLAPDSAIMTKLCQDGEAKCYLMPHSVATSADWLFEYERKNPPLFLQFDVIGANRNKMAALRNAGFGFIDEHTKRCNLGAVKRGINLLAFYPKTIMPEHRFPANWSYEDIYLRLIPFGIQRFQRIRFLTAFRSRFGIKYP